MKDRNYSPGILPYKSPRDSRITFEYQPNGPTNLSVFDVKAPGDKKEKSVQKKKTTYKDMHSKLLKSVEGNINKKIESKIRIKSPSKTLNTS